MTKGYAFVDGPAGAPPCRLLTVYRCTRTHSPLPCPWRCTPFPFPLDFSIFEVFLRWRGLHGIHLKQLKQWVWAVVMA